MPLSKPLDSSALCAILVFIPLNRVDLASKFIESEM